MKTKNLFYCASFLVFMASCKNEDSPSPSIVAKNSESVSTVITGTPPGWMTEKEYNVFLKGKLSSSKVAAYTEHGPFTTGASSRVEIAGPDGNLHVWKLLFTNVPGYTTGTYFCRYYQNIYTLVLPAGQYIVPGSLTASQPGYLESVPPNPISATTETGATFAYSGNQYRFTTYSIIPKYNLSGQDINPGNVSIPANYTSVTFTYKYYTL